MPSSSVVARSLALAMLGLAGASMAAYGQNVTAFNPYSGIGLPGGPTPEYGAQAAYPIVDTVGPGPAGGAAGPAFNPWRPSSPPGSAIGGPVIVTPGPVPAYPSVSAYDPGSYLPSPPPGPIESRIVAVPELGSAYGAPRNLYPSAPPASAPPTMIVTPAPAAPPLPAPAVATRPEPPPAPMPAPAPIPAPARPTPPVAAAPAATPTPAPPPAPVVAPVAVAAPPAAPVEIPSAGRGAVAASVAFAAQSAELSDSAKAELDRIAKNISDRSLRQIELRAYAMGTDGDGRKVSLARALVVRSYLIDKGVKTRIEVGAFSGEGGDRVDILVPNS